MIDHHDEIEIDTDLLDAVTAKSPGQEINREDGLILSINQLNSK